MKYTILLLAIILTLPACKHRDPSLPIPSTIPTPTSTPIVQQEPAQVFVTYDDKSSIEKSFAMAAIQLMNDCYKSGKLKTLWMTHKFKSFNTVFDKSPKTNEEAWEAYIAGAPYALNLRWYTARWGSNVVGYTYNFSDDDWDGGKSETRIYSNTRIVVDYAPKDRAAHWAHELSHQARAGGFVHYTIFQGSVPYEAGDIMEECLQ